MLVKKGGNKGMLPPRDKKKKKKRGERESERARAIRQPFTRKPPLISRLKYSNVRRYLAVVLNSKVSYSLSYSRYLTY